MFHYLTFSQRTHTSFQKLGKMIRLHLILKLKFMIKNPNTVTDTAHNALASMMMQVKIHRILKVGSIWVRPREYIHRRFYHLFQRQESQRIRVWTFIILRIFNNKLTSKKIFIQKWAKDQKTLLVSIICMIIMLVVIVWINLYLNQRDKVGKEIITIQIRQHGLRCSNIPQRFL